MYCKNVSRRIAWFPRKLYFNKARKTNARRTQLWQFKHGTKLRHQQQSIYSISIEGSQWSTLEPHLKWEFYSPLRMESMTLTSFSAPINGRLVLISKFPMMLTDA